MKKIAILLTLCMMLAGCTELADDSTESGELTNQDLEGIYMAAGFGLYVDMNADDTYVVYSLEIEDCYDTEAEANSAMAELNDYEYFEDEYGSKSTTMVVNNCLYIQEPVEDEDGTSFNFSLSSHAGTPYMEMTVTEESYEGDFVCDDGEEIPADWVNDGEDDCSGGEDEAEDAADSLESETMEVRVYVAADGYGTIVYPEGAIDDDAYCMSMGPSEGMFAFYQAMNAMENLSDEELENFDAEDFSTYPTILTDMFTVFDQNYAASAVSSLTSADCGELESMLMSWLYLWAGSLAEDNTDGDFMMYDFNVDDASETVTSESGEALVYVALEAGDDLSWSSIAVQMSVDGGYYSTCTNPDQASDTGCAITDNGDSMWRFGEEITISEGSDDLCESSCQVQIKILDLASNKLIYESSGVYGCMNFSISFICNQQVGDAWGYWTKRIGAYSNALKRGKRLVSQLFSSV